MDNTLEKIYGYIYVGAYAANGFAMLMWALFGFGDGDTISIWFPIIVFGVSTAITFLMGRLVQERFDNTLQMYLLIVSAAYLILAFIPPYEWGITPWEALIALIIFAAAFFLDGIFEAE